MQRFGDALVGVVVDIAMARHVFDQFQADKELGASEASFAKTNAQRAALQKQLGQMEEVEQSVAYTLMCLHSEYL